MKKAEAISILAASVRPREAKDRARYDEAVRMAIEALKCSETPKSSEQNAETAQADHIADTGRKVEQTAETAQNVQNEDLISRKMAIDTLEKQLDYLQMLNKDENPKAESKWYGVNWARNVIADLPSAQPEPHWIPCSERLPEENCRCLTTNETWGLFEVDWNAWIDGQWLYPNEKPIAWMPMPEPYRGGEE